MSLLSFCSPIFIFLFSIFRFSLLRFQFDSYLRSLKIDQNNICLVTDGQLPLRQCLHPEAVTKDIHLPSYYWKFSDLKKDYVQSRLQQSTQNSSSAANDDSKLPNLQPASQPAPIALPEMLNGEILRWYYIDYISSFLLVSIRHALDFPLFFIRRVTKRSLTLVPLYIFHAAIVYRIYIFSNFMSLNDRFSVSLEDNCWKLFN